MARQKKNKGDFHLIISKKGCFNCAHENPKTGYCNLKGNQFGIIARYIHGHSEESIKRTGSACEVWKQGIDLYTKTIIGIKEKVAFT